MANSQKTENSIEQTGANDMGLFVDSWNYSDRFTHSIGLIRPQGKWELATAIEGDSSEIWPCSPPLQQLHKQRIDDDLALLGVGMAGNSHFSCSFLLKNDPKQVQLFVEAACSVSPDTEANARLQSTYRISSGVELVHKDDGTECVIENSKIRIELSPNSKCTVRSENILVFEPIHIHREQATQWGFVVRLLDA